LLGFPGRPSFLSRHCFVLFLLLVCLLTMLMLLFVLLLLLLLLPLSLPMRRAAWKYHEMKHRHARANTVH